MPLTTWHKLTQPQEKGGLGFKDYTTHAHALLSQWVAKALEDPTIEWAAL